jgi:hypothetical protein
MANPADLSGVIQAAAQRYNLDPAFVSAVVQQESKGNAAAWNKSGGGQGAAGPMQVRAPALADYNAANGTNYKMSDLLNPAVGVDVGSWYLNQQLDKFGDPSKALVAYNEGAGSPNVASGSTAYSSSVLDRIGAPATPGATPVDSGYGGAAAGSGASGAPAANSGAASVLAQFGYAPDGKPSATGATASAESAQNAGSSAQRQTQQALPASAGADILAKFGYGSDGKPVAAPGSSRPAPATSQAATQPAAAPARGGFGPVAGDQTANAQEGEDAAQQAQSDFGSGLVHGIQSTVNGAFQTVAHGAKTVANTFGSPDSQLTRAINQWSDAEDRNATSNADGVPATPSGGLGQIVGEVAPTMFVPGGTALKAIAGGGLAGALQPVTNNAADNFWSQKAVQTGLGAASGGVIHGALSGAAALAQGAAKESPLLTQLRNALNGQQLAAQPNPVEGVVPTLAELTQNKNLGVLQRNLAEVNPQPFAAREDANQAARMGAFNDAVKTPQEAEMAANEGMQKAQWQYENSGVGSLSPDADLGDILQRPSMAPVMRRAELLADESGTGNPFQAQREALQAQHNSTFADLAGTPEGIEAAKDARNLDVFDRYQEAGSQEIPVDEGLQMLMQRPSMQRVVARAQRLSDEEGAGPIFVRDEEGNPASLSGGAAHYIKQGLDDEIQLARDNNLGASERRAIQGTQNQFLGWLDNQSPEYASARASYAEQTQPIEAQEYLQGLNVTDANGNVTLPKVDTAIKATEKLRAQPGLSAAKNLTDDQMAQLYGLRDSLRTSENGPDVSQFTPEQIQYVQRALDDEFAKGTTGAAANQNQALTQSRQDLEDWLGARAPGYQESKQTAAASQQALETNQYLQKDITDSMGRLQLNKIEQKIKQIEDAKRLRLDSPAARVDTNSLQELRAIRDSFRNERSALAMGKGSPTSQNTSIKKAWGLNPPQADAGVAGSAASRAAGWATGGGAGWLLGNLIAPGAGSVLGPLIGGGVGGAIEQQFARRAAQKQAAAYGDRIGELTDLFLSPTQKTIEQLNSTPRGSALLRVINAARGAQRDSALANAVEGRSAARAPRGFAGAAGGQVGGALFNQIRR